MSDENGATGERKETLPVDTNVTTTWHVASARGKGASGVVVKDDVIRVRVTSDEKKKLRAAAARSGVTMSRYLVAAGLEQARGRP